MNPRINQIAEVALVVSDVERSCHFYGTVLGLKELRHHASASAGGATFHLGNGFLGLWPQGKWEEINPHIVGAAKQLSGACHVVFYIDPADGDAALENLRKNNVKFWGPRFNEEGEIHIDFQDPDGHLLEYWGRKGLAT